MWNPCICGEYQSDTVLFVFLAVVLHSALMSKCVLILPNIRLFLTFCFLHVDQKEP